MTRPLGKKKRAGKENAFCPFKRTSNALRFFFYPSVPFLEPFNAPGAVYKLLFAGIKWMTLVADVYVGALNGGLCFNNVST